MITIRKSAQTCQKWQWYPCCSWIGTAWERRGRPEGYRPFVTEKDVIIDPSLLRSAHHCFANTLIIVFYVKICEMSCLLSACRCSLSNQLSTSPQCLNGINFPVHDRLQACLSKGRHSTRISHILYFSPILYRFWLYLQGATEPLARPPATLKLHSNSQHGYLLAPQTRCPRIYRSTFNPWCLIKALPTCAILL